MLLIDLCQLFVLGEKLIVLFESCEILRPDLSSQAACIRGQLVSHARSRVLNPRALLTVLLCLAEVNVGHGDLLPAMAARPSHFMIAVRVRLVVQHLLNGDILDHSAFLHCFLVQFQTTVVILLNYCVI